MLETFATADDWAATIAGRLEETLGAAVVANGRAMFAGPGGSTPSPVYARLAQTDIGWDRIAVTLVDERYVPETSPESNARLIREVLLQGTAAPAHLHPAVPFGGHRRPGGGGGGASVGASRRPVRRGPSGDGRGWPYLFDVPQLSDAEDPVDARR